MVGVAETVRLDCNRWRLGMMHTAHRTSLVASGDVLGCLEYIIRADRRLAAAAAVSPADLIEAARSFPEVLDAITFVLSDEYASLRVQVT